MELIPAAVIKKPRAGDMGRQPIDRRGLPGQDPGYCGDCRGIAFRPICRPFPSHLRPRTACMPQSRGNQSEVQQLEVCQITAHQEVHICPQCNPPDPKDKVRHV